MVFVEQIYTNCMAAAAYFVHSDGVAAVVDPLRDPTPYLEMAKKHNVTIKYIFETHFHADFVSGHVDLAKAAGPDCQIVYGPTAVPTFDALIAEDGEVIEVGKAKIVVMHTPGHTMESSSFLLIDEEDKQTGVFSGDTLFIGDVGRPDLAQKAASMTQEELAQKLFQSLRQKIMPLGDELTVWPGHGAGSACGKNLSAQTIDTMGNQKKTNYALRADMTEAEFVEAVCDGLMPPPRYFGSNVAMNKGVNATFDEVLARGSTPISLADFEAMQADEAVLLLDVRKKELVVGGYIPKTIFAGADSSLALWVGAVFPDVTQKIALVAENEEQAKDAVSRLARVGMDNVVGHLAGGVDAWKAAGKPVLTVACATPANLSKELAADADALKVLDVRGGGEYRNEHVTGSLHVPLCGYQIDLEALPQDKPLYTYCRTGWRSLMFITRAVRLGSKAKFVQLDGGFTDVKAEESMHKHLFMRECPKMVAAREAAAKAAGTAVNPMP